MTGQELKKRTLDERERVLCQNCKYRYCPTYECGLLNKCKELTDRQWDNIAKKENDELKEIIINLNKEINKLKKGA